MKLCLIYNISDSANITFSILVNFCSQDFLLYPYHYFSFPLEYLDHLPHFPLLHLISFFLFSGFLYDVDEYKLCYCIVYCFLYSFIQAFACATVSVRLCLCDCATVRPCDRATVRQVASGKCQCQWQCNANAQWPMQWQWQWQWQWQCQWQCLAMAIAGMYNCMSMLVS